MQIDIDVEQKNDIVGEFCAMQVNSAFIMLASLALSYGIFVLVQVDVDEEQENDDVVVECYASHPLLGADQLAVVHVVEILCKYYLGHFSEVGILIMCMLPY